MTLRCKTKYPIVLVHGIGLRDYKYIKYWGNIPTALRDEGAKVFFGKQDAWGSIENNASTVKRKILEVIEETGAEKVNIVAHSKGGLDMRYMISELGMENLVASLTTISTPHHGSKSMDVACRLPDWLFKFASFFANKYFKIAGDNHPDFFKVCHQLTTKKCADFNKRVIDINSIYYQSYTSVMKNKNSDIKFSLIYPIVKHIEGENDGIVTVKSAKWGEYQGMVDKDNGGSHSDISGFNLVTHSKTYVVEFYIELVESLKNRGF